MKKSILLIIFFALSFIGDNTTKIESNNIHKNVSISQSNSISNELIDFEEDENYIEYSIDIETKVENVKIAESEEDNKNNIQYDETQLNSQLVSSSSDDKQIYIVNEIPILEVEQTEEISNQETEIVKTIYDYEFDVDAIKQELIDIGISQGLTHITSDERGIITPDNSSWGNPITASVSFQGQNLERTLKDYVSSMPTLITAYGGNKIEYFTIYVQNQGNGNYTFYFLY